MSVEHFPEESAPTAPFPAPPVVLVVASVMTAGARLSVSLLVTGQPGDGRRGGLIVVGFGVGEPFELAAVEDDATAVIALVDGHSVALVAAQLTWDFGPT